MLKCINFTNKVHVEITEELIKFAADQSRVTQGQSLTIVLCILKVGLLIVES